MTTILSYIRSLIGGWTEEPAAPTSSKRDRGGDDSSDDDSPALKRLKALKRTNFPEMSSNDPWSEKEKSKNVRYVPIQIEAGHPSTSTPIDVLEKLGGSRVSSLPVKLVGTAENGQPTPLRKPRMHTPVRPVMRAMVDDDDEPQLVRSWVEEKPEKSKKPSRVYIDLDDDTNGNDEDNEDVIFVKKATSPPPVRPHKYFLVQNNVEDEDEEEIYYKINRKSSPRTYSTKFKAPPGITKSYKKAPVPIPRWLQSQNSNLSNSRNRYYGVNGNARSALSEVFNLDEKRNYQELIRRVAGTTKPMGLTKPLDIINLAEDAASFRMTQRSQRNALNEIKFAERDIAADRNSESAKEYDPITVASINSSDSEVEIVPSESSSSSIRINPVNTLRDSFRDRAVTFEDFLLKLDSKYKKKRQDTQAKICDARRESDIISKVNSEQKIAQLEQKLKYELSIPESLIEEPQPTVELPKLTAEQEKLINKVLGPGPPNQMLVEKFNLRIHRRDIQTLAGLNWLNDEVINFYMNLLMQRSEDRKDLPKVYATNTFFYPKLMQSGQAGLRRWTRKVDIFAHDLMVIPVHLGVHWCLSLVDLRERKVKYLDSMGGRNQQCLDALLQYLREEHQDKKGQALDDSGWKAECLSKDIPQQMNGSDCGMFACTFAEFSSRNAPYTFTQSHMPYLRRKMALEILQGKLLL